jgi:DNA polymerase II large subunit
MPVLTNALPNAAAFRNSLVKWVEEHAAQIRSRGVITNKGPDLLDALATRLRGLANESQVLRNLQLTSSRLPKPPGGQEVFVPSTTQSRIVANVSNPASESSVDEILEELIAAGTEDALVAVAAEQGEREKSRADERIQRAEEDADLRAFKAEELATAAVEKQHHSEAEVADLRKENEHLRAALEGKPCETKAKPKAKAAA